MKQNNSLPRWCHLLRELLDENRGEKIEERVERGVNE